MSKAKSSSTHTLGATTKSEQASIQSKDAVRRRQINMHMVQNVLLIWLDKNNDDKTADYYNTMTQLRGVVNNINKYTNEKECIEFLKTIENEKACMIISSSFGQHIMPRVHNMPQVDSIFILCSNKKNHEQWIKRWSKIKRVFTKISSICEALKSAAQQCEQNAIPISFVPTIGDVLKKNLDQVDSSFMYTQILKESLLSIEFEESHFKTFIDYCHDVFTENDDALKNVNKFEQEYRNETPIWWYTSECFLYPMLNRALRLMDMDIIIKMGFFIVDLHRQIDHLYQEQFSGQKSGRNFTVYRGQGMSKNEFEQMTKMNGGLISFNNFLFTSKSRAVSLDFASRVLTNPDLVGVLFVIIINPYKSTKTPFASIVDVSCYKDKEEKEVLFTMHSVFRIRDILPMAGNQRLFQVELTLTNDNDKGLCRLTDHIRETSSSNSKGWYRLGLMLLKMSEFDNAEEVYEILLDQTTNESEKGSIYQLIGLTKYSHGKYNEAITYYQESLEIYKKNCLSNDANLASAYTNIGMAYYSMGKYSKALSYYDKALTIRQQLLPSNHPDLASSYNNNGTVYRNMGDYSKALLYYEKSFEIRQQSLSSNDPDLGVSYNNIGLVYENIGNYSKARLFYERAVDIGEHSLPANHPVLKHQILTARQPWHGSLLPTAAELSKSYKNIQSIAFYPKSKWTDVPIIKELMHGKGVVCDRLDWKIDFHDFKMP